jgi:hypothetical protein
VQILTFITQLNKLYNGTISHTFSPTLLLATLSLFSFSIRAACPRDEGRRNLSPSKGAAAAIIRCSSVSCSALPDAARLRCSERKRLLEIGKNNRKYTFQKLLARSASKQ